MSDCACTTAYMCNIHRRPIKDIHTTGGVVGGHLGSPTPEQIDHDIIGELSSLRQKIADLETAKEFNAHIHDNIIKRLNEVERKLEAIEEQFLHFIELRKIKGTG